MGTPPSIALISADLPYLTCLRTSLERSQELSRINKYHDTAQAIAALKLQRKSASQPDLILIDINRMDDSSLADVALLRSTFAGLPILVLTADTSSQNFESVIKLGVSGYLLKDCGLQQIKRSINDIIAGGASMDPVTTQRMFGKLSTKCNEGGNYSLSKRQLQVLQLLADGKLKKEIAEELNLSYHTVVMHTRYIYEKFGVKNVSAAVSKAIKTGIV